MKNIKFAKALFAIGSFIATTNDGAGGCSSCGEPPAEKAPTYLTAAPTLISTGIGGWVMIHCSIATDFDWADKDAIETAVANGLIAGRLKGCRIKGSNGTPSTQTKNVGACNGDVTTSVTESWSLQDYENDCDFTMNDLYNYVNCYGDSFLFGPISCDYRLTKPRAVQNLIAYVVEGDNSDDCTYWQLNWETKKKKCDPTIWINMDFLQSCPEIFKPPAGAKAIEERISANTVITSNEEE